MFYLMFSYRLLVFCKDDPSAKQSYFCNSAKESKALCLSDINLALVRGCDQTIIPTVFVSKINIYLDILIYARISFQIITYVKG